MNDEEASEGAASPGKAEPVAVEEKLAFPWDPLHREELEGVAKPADGIGEMCVATRARRELLST